MAELHRGKLQRSIEIAAGTPGRAVSRRVVVSTARMDRNSRVVEQKWDLANYRANPVVLYGHDDRRYPIGQAEGVAVKGSGSERRLEATLAFDTEENEHGAAVAALWDKGLLRTVSAGWIPLEDPEYVYDEETGAYLFTRYPKNELAEISVVAVPANPDAQRIAASLELGPQLADLFPPSKPPLEVRSAAAGRMTLNRAALDRLRR